MYPPPSHSRNGQSSGKLAFDSSHYELPSFMSGTHGRAETGVCEREFQIHSALKLAGLSLL